MLTHGDTDHLGFAERLRHDHGIPVFVHGADAARARGEVKIKVSWGYARLGATAGFLWYAVRNGGLRTTYLTEVSEVADGDVLDLPGAPRILGVPGHSPGSIAVHVPEVDAVFVGDGLTTRHVLTGQQGAPHRIGRVVDLPTLTRARGESRRSLSSPTTAWPTLNNGRFQDVR